MSARTVPTMPAFLAGQKLTATLLNQVGAYGLFWADKPSFRMYQSVGQSVASGTWTQITCDTLDYDSDSGRQSTTPYSYIIPAGMSGRWAFGWQIPWTNNATGGRDSGIRKNGSAISGYTGAAPEASGGQGGIGWTDTIAVNAGDSISLWGFQSSGGALATVVAADTFTIFWGRLESLGNP